MNANTVAEAISNAMERLEQAGFMEAYDDLELALARIEAISPKAAREELV